MHTGWADATARRTAALHWGLRPIHYRAVHEFRAACESSDGRRLASLLDPAVAVVVDDSGIRHPGIKMVRGVAEAIPLLMHAMAAKAGLVIDERPINGQAGLMLRRNDEAIAAINVDFSGRLISAVWVRLHPVELRHWNRV